jgi:hypothetical protein
VRTAPFRLTVNTNGDAVKTTLIVLVLVGMVLSMILLLCFVMGNRPLSTSENPAANVSTAPQRTTVLLDRQVIEDHLRSLAARTGIETFVIFEETRTQKFVQFSGPLLLDLPHQPLAPDELQRARDLFSTIETATIWPHVFQVDLGTDVEGATELTLRIFREVYRFPETIELSITEN